MSRPENEAVEFVREAFSVIWPVHLSGLTKLLIQLRKNFDNDLELMLVLAVIGDRTRPGTWQPEPITYRQITRRKDEEHQQFPINTQSIADYTGIPRETVRRKVLLLESKGWVERDTDGRLTISPSAAVDLEQATTQSIEYLAAISGAVLSVKRRTTVVKRQS